MGRGQPTKLTPAVQARIVDALELGNYLKVACVCGGVGYSTMRGWIVRGEREGSGEYFKVWYPSKCGRGTLSACRHGRQPLCFELDATTRPAGAYTA